MKRICFAILMVATLATRSAQAQVDVTLNQPQADDFARAISGGTMTAAELEAQLETKVNDLFQVANVGSFLKGFQDAQSFSAKGLGVDYASEATLVEGGATFSFAPSLDKAYKPSGNYSDPPVRGGGANFSLMAGLGFGVFGFDPLMVFANWFKGNASIGQLEGSYHNWGLHGQLRLLGPSRRSSATSLLVRWGGIAITSGADYSRLSLSAKKTISSSFNVVQGAPVTVTSDGDLTFNVDQTTWTVPLEVTTSVRLLSLLTLYGGLGLDWQLGGGSNMKIGMTAKMNGSYKETRYGDIGTVRVDASGHVSPSPARIREIVGVQIAFLDLIRIFTQVNISDGSPMLMSIAAGLRLGI